MGSVRDELLVYAGEKYGTEPDRPFVSSPEALVLRHGNGRWYALFMEIPASKLGLARGDRVEIVNLKCDPILSGSLRDGVGIFPAYHQNHQSWISVLLDGTVAASDIEPLLDISFSLTAGKSGGRISRWLIPANPAYYDLEKALEERGGEFLWKQSSAVHVGDDVYIYMAAPVSAVVYKCRAVEVDIPANYDDGVLRIKREMRLVLLRRYDREPIGRDRLRDHGVYAVRGPRSMPGSLIEEIEAIYGGAEENDTLDLQNPPAGSIM